MRFLDRPLRLALLGSLLGTLQGCLVAAAGAGAAAGIYLTDRGASAMVEGPVLLVEERARSALAQMRVEVTETRAATDDTRRELRGRTQELEVTVTLEARGPATTEVVAVARRSPVEWDRAFSRALVQRIVEQR